MIKVKPELIQNHIIYLEDYIKTNKQPMFLRDNKKNIEILGKKVDIKFDEENFYCCKTNCKQIYQAMKKGAKEGYILSEYRKVIGSWNLSNNELIEKLKEK